MLHTVDCQQASGTLSPESLQAFAQDGAVLLKSLLGKQDYEPVFQDLAHRLSLLEKHHGYTPPHADTNASGLSERIRRLNEEHPGCQSLLYDAMNNAPGMHQFAVQEKLLNVIQTLLSPTVEIHPRYILLMSLPEEEWHLAGWHQDFYYNEGPESTLTIYAPLQKTNIHNGSLLLALGEHLRGPLEHGDHQASTKWHTLPQETVSRFSRVASAELELGDVLIFNSLVPHTARVNQSHAIRFVINLRYRDLSEPQFLQEGWRIGPIQQARQALARRERG
jgi:hypothetical protein